MIESGNK
jgi:hypothetical protein